VEKGAFLDQEKGRMPWLRRNETFFTGELQARFSF
jgi:hypothetical protein